jgi:hypothetical protein
VIPDRDVAACLARLAREAIVPAAACASVSWRGLHISFSAQRQWRQVVLAATISAGYASLPVELSQAWTSKGQHWRIEKEITARIDGAAATARRLRDDIQDLQRRAADATRRSGEPFPQAAELEAARARRDAIEQDIRDAAAPPQDDNAAAPPGDDDLAAAGTGDLLAMTGLEDVQEITFIPAMILPDTGERPGGAGQDRLTVPLAAQDVPAPPAAALAGRVRAPVLGRADPPPAGRRLPGHAHRSRRAGPPVPARRPHRHFPRPRDAAHPLRRGDHRRLHRPRPRKRPP